MGKSDTGNTESVRVASSQIFFKPSSRSFWSKRMSDLFKTEFRRRIILSPMVTRRRRLAELEAMSILPLGKGEAQSMDQRVSLVTLGVKDLGVSKRFYAKGFGWKPVFENKEIVFFQTGGMIFALLLRDHVAAELRADQATFGRAPKTLLTTSGRKMK